MAIKKDEDAFTSGSLGRHTSYFYQALNSLLKTTQIEVWKDKAAFEEMNNSARYLSKPFRDARFAKYNTKIRGEKVPTISAQDQ